MGEGVFNNEILAHQAAPIQGSTKPYYHCLEQLKLLAGKKNEEQTPQVVLHTDQGSVYSSQAFRQAHEHYNILRSMSKVGTPTDNAIIEAINGRIKEELFLDFGLATAKDVPKSMFITIITSDLRPPWAIKAQFSTRPNYKWSAIVDFQKAFDLSVSADGFTGMLKEAKDATENLIDSYTQPFHGLYELAKREPETVRAMLTDLLEDDGGDLVARQDKIDTFL